MKSIPVVDDLGNQQFLDPVKTHQELQEFLKGVQNSEDLLYRMCKKGKPGEAKIPWMQPIVDILLSQPMSRTQFFCDFKRNFQPYSIMFDDKAEGSGFIRKIKTRVLNKAKNYLKGLQQKIQHDASQIDNYLEQRVMILQNVARLLDKAAKTCRT